MDIENPVIPFCGNLTGSLQPGNLVRIRGTVTSSATCFSVNLQNGPSVYQRGDVALHLSPVFSSPPRIVRNSLENQNWGPEESHGPYFPLSSGQSFEIMILIESDHFKIAINGQHFTEFPYRLPLQSITYISVDGDVAISMIKTEGMTKSPSAPSFSSGDGISKPLGFVIDSNSQANIPGPPSSAPPHNVSSLPYPPSATFGPSPTSFVPPPSSNLGPYPPPSGRISPSPYGPPSATNPYGPPPTSGSNPYGPPPTGATNPYGPPPTGATNPYGPPPTGATNPYGPPSTGGSNPYGPPPGAYPSQPSGYPQTGAGYPQGSGYPQQHPSQGYPSQPGPYPGTSVVYPDQANKKSDSGSGFNLGSLATAGAAALAGAAGAGMLGGKHKKKKHGYGGGMLGHGMGPGALLGGVGSLMSGVGGHHKAGHHGSSPIPIGGAVAGGAAALAGAYMLSKSPMGKIMKPKKMKKLYKHKHKGYGWGSSSSSSSD